MADLPRFFQASERFKMRLRPGPLVEASAVFAVSWLLALGYLVFADMSFIVGLNDAITVAILFMMPAFSVWAIGGWIFKELKPTSRFYMNLASTAAVAVGVYLLFTATLQETTGLTEAQRQSQSQYFLIIGIVFAFSCFIGSAVTYFLILQRDATIRKRPLATKATPKPKSKR